MSPPTGSQALAPETAAPLMQWAGGALVGVTVLVLVASWRSGSVSAADTIAFGALFGGAYLGSESARWLPGPLSRALFPLVPALLGLGVIGVVQGLADWIVIDKVVVFAGLFAGLFAAWVATSLAGELRRLSPLGQRPARVVVIGSRRAAEALHRELELSGARGYVIVGYVPAAANETAGPGGEIRELGPLNSLNGIVRQQRIDLLLMTSDASRLTVFDEVARSCLHLPVRFCELASFHEDLFGHVPVTEINTAWFQYIIHPRYSPQTSLSKRLVDVTLGGLAVIAWLPALVLFGLIIKLDGGPALFRQVRIGEQGRPFVLYKLRTMKPSVGEAAQWADENDPRITRIGRFLRRTHIDELAQFLNVLRGDMSLVGPRPEQPEFVERLEATLPFYQRRHLIKPGISGWAQVRCGYAGSETGSLWKLSHDLYYLKHRRMALDLAIMWESVVETLRRRPHYVDPKVVGWVFDELSPVKGVSNGIPAGSVATVTPVDVRQAS
jgi:exopolysaccharide biosynthesis polyprenyl glycosylphosphotransferase